MIGKISRSKMLFRSPKMAYPPFRKLCPFLYDAFFCSRFFKNLAYRSGKDKNLTRYLLQHIVMREDSHFCAVRLVSRGERALETEMLRGSAKVNVSGRKASIILPSARILPE